MKLQINQIVPDSDQPRKYFDPRKIERLKDSIKNEGILTPLIVEKIEDNKYLLIDGERRYRCAVVLKFKEVPVKLLKPMSPEKRDLVRFQIHNESSDWTTIEKGKSLIKVLKTGITDQMLRSIIGISKETLELYKAAGSLDEKQEQLIIESEFPQATILPVCCILRNLYGKQDYMKHFGKFIGCLKSKKITEKDKLRKVRTISNHLDFEENVLKFINDKKYTYNQLLVDTEIDKEIVCKRISTKTQMLFHDIQRAWDLKITPDMKKIKHLINFLNSFCKEIEKYEDS